MGPVQQHQVGTRLCCLALPLSRSERWDPCHVSEPAALDHNHVDNLVLAIPRKVDS